MNWHFLDENPRNLEEDISISPVVLGGKGSILSFLTKLIWLAKHRLYWQSESLHLVWDICVRMADISKDL